MPQTPEERALRIAEREKEVAADEAAAKRLLAGARAAHREAERERARARKLAARFASKFQQTLAAARAQIEADRAAVDAKVAKLNAAQSAFNLESAADRDRLHNAWADLEARQKRLTEEWEEANRFQAEQAAALLSRETEQAAREKAEAEARAKLQREVSALREEAASLETRIRNSRQTLEELEQRRAALRVEVLAPPAGAEPPPELGVALDRAADRDLEQWGAELEAREKQLNQDRAALGALAAGVAKENALLADRRRVLAEQFAQLAVAREQWQEAERLTVAEMEQLACTLRRREAELDARDQRLIRADARRREEAYQLWQTRLRLEAWQSKIVAYEMRWHVEREQLEADFARRTAELAGAEDAIPLALAVTEQDSAARSTELTTLREELDRMAAVLLEAELPEPPDPPESELPWGTEDVPMAIPHEDEAEVLWFEPAARAA